ncbi:MAG: hypothetical protein MJ109_07190 [Kiritimatiellae bacterium]|nr:hypothetical protein [Kiritimatiellia bacterium]
MPRHKKPTGDSDPVSHDDDSYFDELSEFFTPYTEDEIRLHSIDRELKNAVEERHARNYRLIPIAQQWSSFIYHNGPKPKINIGDVILEEVSESRAANLAKPIKVFCKALKEYGENMIPHIRVINYCSRSTATLYQLLEEINPTPELTTLINIERKILGYLVNQGFHFESAAEFNEHVTHLYSQYLAFASAYGSQLSAFIVEKERDFKLRLTGRAGSLLATKDDVKSAAKSSETKIKRAIKAATSDPIASCHHRNKKKDVIVQKVISYLSTPGITFSIHNACKKVAPDEGSWLYDWCHAHESNIQEAVDMNRTAK